MSLVAIVGAGEVGGALAQALAIRDRVAVIRLIDRSASVAAGKALDLQQAGSVEGFSSHISASDDPRDVVGAAVIVFADPIGASLSLDGSLALVDDLARLAPTAPLVGALASHRDLVEAGTARLGLPRARLIGSAPVAYASAIRALVGLTLDVSPADVSLSVLGCPPAAAVVPWSEANVGGFRLEAVASPAELASIRRLATALWPPGPYALASSAAALVDAILTRSRRAWPCFVTLDAEFGARGRAAAMPVLVGPQGVRRVIVPSLTTQERVALETALHEGTKR